MRAHQELQRDPLAYVSHIGKADRQHTIDALHEQGRDTIVRLCFTPGEYQVPLRLLGYIAAAQHITRTYLPEAQLQIVAPIHAAARINRTPLALTAQTAQRTFASAAAHPALQRSRPTRMLFGTDKPGEHPGVRIDRIAPLTRRYPEAKVLSASARDRRANYPAYVAAHLVLHDMVDSVAVTPYSREQPDLTAQRIISIGALSEQAFYAARLRCRDAPLFDTDDMVTATGQIFTRHVIPPYNFTRHPGGDRPEPYLSTPRGAFLNLRDAVDRTGQVIRPVHTDRDLAYLHEYIEHYAPGVEYPPARLISPRETTAGV